MLVASTSVFGVHCTTPAAKSWRTPPSRPRASGYRSPESASGRRVAKGERPHPWRTDRRGVHLHDAADDGAISEDIEIAVVPLAG